MTDSYVYVRSEPEQWIPARVVEKASDHCTVIVEAWSDPAPRQNVDLNDYPNQVLPLQNVDAAGRLNLESDMANLPFLHEAAILYNVKARHEQRQPYTRAGCDILIAVNPYQRLDNLYTSTLRQAYARAVWDSPTSEKAVLPPHIYETSAKCYQGLARMNGTNQSLLVSGESGAGKTETVKIALSHLAFLPSNEDASVSTLPIVERIMESNPLLEAFGNAQTSRNDNSSRFGKYIALQFAVGSNDTANVATGLRPCTLVGSTCHVYLLEQSRVVHHGLHERSFHIFYQLLAAPDHFKRKVWSKLADQSVDSFRYLSSGTPANSAQAVSRVASDAAQFQTTLQALQLVGIRGKKLDALLKAMVAVLQLGNIGFVGCADESHVSTPTELDDLATLLGVPVSHLGRALTQRTLRTRGETLVVPIGAEAARESCHALAKAIYQVAFDRLVVQINKATKAESTHSHVHSMGTIGLLDIFGFESFGQNGFEQLCINYANEKLQQKFTEDVFRHVQAEYESEGITLHDVSYDDNAHVLHLIESRMGLVAMLNEECVRPGGSDKEFVYKALRQNIKSTALVQNKRFSALEFGIVHYAGSVVYTAHNFIGKNNDTLAMDLVQCAGLSSNTIVARVARAGDKGKDDLDTSARRAGSNVAGATVWTKYRASLKSLMDELYQTNSRYIRCIKPNDLKLPGIMHHKSTLDQLRSAGVIAAVTISRSAYPNRLEHQYVLDRFQRMVRLTDTVAPHSSLVDRVQTLLCRLLSEFDATGTSTATQMAFAMGKTRVYFRAGAFEYLEAQRVQRLDQAAIRIQALVRHVLAKLTMMKARLSNHTVQQQHRAATTLTAMARGHVCRVTLRKNSKGHQAIVALRLELAMLQQQVATGAVVKFEPSNDRVLTAIRQNSLAPSINDSIDMDAAVHELKRRTDAIDKMRFDNKKLRTIIKKVEAKQKRLQDECLQSQSENDTAIDQFHALNQRAKDLDARNTKAMETQAVWRKQIIALGEDLRVTQARLQESADNRLKYEAAMADILKMLRLRCKDEELIEDCIFIALDSDTEAKGVTASFEAVQAHWAKKGTEKASAPTKVSGDMTDFTEGSTSHGDDSSDVNY